MNKMNKHRVWLIGFILIAFGLRLTLLDEQSLWYDEGVTWMLSQMKLPDLIDWTAADIQPPLYYLLIWTTEIVTGDSEWALRFPSVIFNMLTIPLVYVLARRLFYRPSAQASLLLDRSALAVTPLLAAAVLVFSPLMVYYSQEARMYTLLTFEATLAGYLLLKILHPQVSSASAAPLQLARLRLSRPAAAALLYLFTAAAALYTHYFAVFLFMAHALYALFILWQRRFPRPLFLQLLFSFGGALLLFSPWLPVLLARLGDDPSYWPGALKLDEALRKVAISFVGGETVFEQTGWQLMLGYLAILALVIIWNAVWQGRSRRMTASSEAGTGQDSSFSLLFGFQPASLLFLLLWLLLPIALILILSYQSPKFNPRYTLLSWPAFAIILAAVLARFRLPQLSGRPLRVAHSALRLAFYIFIFGVMIYSLTNWFSDPRFSKDDFQALAQFVRERKAADETVLLSSGHMFPVWAYYYGWEGWTPLPWMLRLDVNRVTNLEIAADMAEAVANHGGVWLVSWQDEVIDPNGVVPFWLDRIGPRPVDAGDFWGVGLEHWRLDPDKIALLKEDPIRWPVEINFANQLDLIGYTQLNDAELVLFWRPRQPLPDDLMLTFDITDAEGFSWDRESFTGRPGSYLYPPSRWPAGQTIITRHRLNWQIGAPPGLYLVEVGLGQAGATATSTATASAAPAFKQWDVLDRQGRPQRDSALLEHINLSHLVQPPGGRLPQENDPLVDFFPIIGLRRSILVPETAQPGDRILLALLWQAGEFNFDDISIAIDLIDAAGTRHRVGSSLTPSRQFNLPRWKPGDMVLGQYWLDIPPEATPGPGRLEVHLVNLGGFRYREIFPFDELEILPTERNFSPPETVDIPLEAGFSGQATLIGADCPNNCRATAGETLSLTLYWRADAPFETGYTIFTHLLGPDETVLVNADHAPPKSTRGWVAGEIITDPVSLAVPADLPPGEYAIEVGLYDAADPAFQRLPLDNGETRVILPQYLSVE